MTCNLYDELALRGETYGHNSCMINNNFFSWSNSTIEISWVMTIISPVSPEFKILQEGFAQMQNNAYEACILKAGSNLFKWDKG